MKAVWLYIFFCSVALGQAQSVFTGVRKNISGGDLAKCTSQLDSCLDKDYYKDSALYYKALVALKSGDVKGARKTHTALSSAYPGFKGLHYLNGLIYFSAENYGKSIDAFNLALKDDPANVKIIFNRSLAFGMVEEYLSAIEDLTACITLQQDYALAYYSRAYWYEFTGNYAEAARDYESAIRLEPRNYDAYLGLAYVYQNQHETAKACQALSSAIQQGSQEAAELKEIFCK